MTKATRRRRKGSRGRVARGVLAKVTTLELQQELARRSAALKKLQQQRSELVNQVRQIDAELAALDGVSAAVGRATAAAGPKRAGGRVTGRRRPRNAMSLADALAKLLQGRAMSVSEAAEAVQRAGYRTTSPNFRTIVNQTLIRDSRFRKVARGRYTAG